MQNKDKINRISGIASLGMFLILLLGYVVGNESLLGFPNAMLLYALMPSALVWFGTRKNGCGSCNQNCSVSESEQAHIESQCRSKTSTNKILVFDA